jgi:hypothetical protein
MANAKAATAVEYTQEELNEFRDLVEAGESLHQLERIRSRLAMPKFIDRVGRDKCDAMFEVLKREKRPRYS